MKINGNEIRPGNVLEHNGGLWAVVKDQCGQARQGRRFQSGRDEEPDRRHQAQ
jgi:elongation factor P